MNWPIKGWAGLISCSIVHACRRIDYLTGVNNFFLLFDMFLHNLVFCPIISIFRWSYFHYLAISNNKLSWPHSISRSVGQSSVDFERNDQSTAEHTSYRQTNESIFQSSLIKCSKVCAKWQISQSRSWTFNHALNNLHFSWAPDQQVQFKGNANRVW